MCASRWTTAKRRRAPRVSRRFGLIELLEARTMLVGEFTDLGNLGLDGVFRGTAAWGDYDNDGDLDILLTGAAAGIIPTAKVYRNDSGSFVDISASLVPVTNGTAAWGDYDNDGDLDILLTGRDSGGVSIAKVYRNDSSGSFTDISASLTGVRYSSVAWGDYDNDGDLDILLTGRDTGNNNITRIYRNDGSNSFVDSSVSLPNVSFGSVAWGDYDNDGDLDIFLDGTSTTGRRTLVFRNDGNSSFTDIAAGLPLLNNGSAAWGDYDNDGDLDLLLTGQDGGGVTHSLIYRNNGSGNFSDISAGLADVFYGSVAWGDYDNDGDLDILLTGRTASPTANITRIYRNDSGTFTDISTTVTGVDLSSVAWGDYDKDGDLDILLSGRDSGDNLLSHVIRNNAATANALPSAPTGLTSTVVSGTSVTFSWTAATDAQSPSLGLNYNLRVGTTPGGSDVFSTMANTTTGLQRIPNAGPIQGTSYTLKNLTPGTTYYWSVQAIDTAFAGGLFATETSVVTNTTPTVISPTATNLTSNSATLGGTVTADGGATITERGILLAKTSVNNNPQLNGPSVTKLTATGTTGVFTVGATGLDPLTGYSYVAFATNAQGTTYTTVTTFSTTVSPPVLDAPIVFQVAATSARIVGSVTTGSAQVTEFGYVIAKTTDDATPQIGEANVSKIVLVSTPFTGRSGFTSLHSGLDPATQYSFAIFATYSGGTAYSSFGSFTTLAAAPTITAPTATNVTSNSATLGGNVTTDNGAAITERGVLYARTSDNANPQLNGTGVTKLTATGTTGVFTVNAPGLDFATGYSYVAFATNSEGTTYTTVDTFTTLAAAPTVTSPTQANITSNSATLGGNVTTDNGAAITERGILLARTSVNNNPQLNGNGVTKLTSTGTTGVFTVNATGLDPLTGYSYVAFATNSEGTTYTTVNTFSTIGFPPTVTSPTATNITLTTVTLGGNVTSDGQVAITERGIVYSVTSLNGNPQIGGTAVVQLTAPGTTGTFTIDVSALPTGTQFSYAAYATNTVGTTYTTIGTFTTQPAIGQLPGITVQVLGNVMTITGTAQDDTIKVASDGHGGLIVSSNQPINGLPSPQTFTGATSFVANTLGGNDDVWLAAPLTFDSVAIDLAAGNDRLVLGADPNNAINNNVLDPQFGTLGYLTVNGPVSVTGGEGNDRVIERSTQINGIKTINLGEGNNEYNVYWGFSNETNFSSGAGQDNVYIGYLSSRQASQFDTGAGNDLISYYASRFYKTAYLNTGTGADTVALDVNIYDDSTTVDTGSEADYLLFSRSVAYSSVTLTTSAGADYILIGKYISGLSSSGGAVYSNGGSNIDQLTLNTGSEVDSVQIAANVMRLFYANLGDAYDDADVSYNLFTDGLLDGGGQSTRLKLTGNKNLRTRNPG